MRLTPDQAAGWDVFLSYARSDVAEVRPLAVALRDQGVSVFLDEASIETHESITHRIRHGLAASRLLLAYYSRDYPHRTACQRELLAAVLAGMREGDSRRRVLVVCPEPDGDHIHPVELRDARWQAAPARPQERREFAARVAARAARISDPLGIVGGGDPPRWVPERRSGTPRFAGRFAHVWQVHSALQASSFEFVMRTTPAPVAGVYGLPGIGKTSLVEQYALDFEPGYPGGVFWIDANGDMATYTAELRRVADALGLAVRRLAPERLLSLIADQLTARRRTCLWVVDDLPPGLGPSMLVPSPVVRTIVTSRSRIEDFATPVPLSGLAPEEALRLLTAERTPDGPGEEDAARALVEDVDGHPLALKVAGRALRDRDGVVSFAGYRERIRDGSTGLDSVRAVVADRLRELDAIALDVLRLAAVLDAAPVPARLICRVLARLHSWDADAAERAGQALETIADLCLAIHSGAAWEAHRLVLDAVDVSFTDGPTRTRVAGAAAREILAMADGRDDVTGHAAALAGRGDLPVDDRLALLRLAAERHASRGDVVSAAALWERVLELGTGEVAELVAAARAVYLAGGYELAIAYGQRALEQGAGPDEAWRSHLLLARSLDRLGRYPEADSHWNEIVDGRPPSAREDVELQVGRARGHRMRGRLDAAQAGIASVLERTMSDDPAVELELLGGRIELARLQLQRERVREAKATADEVVRAYRERGLARHPDCLEAQAVWADAATQMDPRDFSWSARLHQDAVTRLRLVHDEHLARLGPQHPLTVITAAQLGLGLLRGRDVGEARELLTATELVIRGWPEPNLPLLYRVGYAKGLADVRLHHLAAGMEILDAVHAGQLAVLGPRHPDTLDTQLELAVALMLSGEMARARTLLSELGRAIPEVLGRNTNRYIRVLASRAFSILPGPAMVGIREIEAAVEKTADALSRLRGGQHRP